MNSRAIRPLAIIFIISISPGCLLLLYSRTFIIDGIGAVSFFWQPWWHGEAELNVSESCPVATKTINGEGLSINSFNTGGAIVSIVVVSEHNGTLLNQSLVSGEVSGIYFPGTAPTGWVKSQDFNITVFWEGFNTTVSFYYMTMYVAHADGSVYSTKPGFEEVENLGFILWGTGLVVFVVHASTVLVRNRRLPSSDAQQ